MKTIARFKFAVVAAAAAAVSAGCADWYDDSPTIQPAYLRAADLYEPAVIHDNPPTIYRDPAATQPTGEVAARYDTGGDAPSGGYGNAITYDDGGIYEGGVYDGGYSSYYDAYGSSNSLYAYGPAPGYYYRYDDPFFYGYPFYRSGYRHRSFYSDIYGRRYPFSDYDLGYRGRYDRRFGDDRRDGRDDVHVPFRDDRDADRGTRELDRRREDRTPREPGPVVYRDDRTFVREESPRRDVSPVRAEDPRRAEAPRRADVRQRDDSPRRVETPRQEPRPVRDAGQAIDRNQSRERPSDRARSDSSGRDAGRDRSSARDGDRGNAPVRDARQAVERRNDAPRESRGGGGSSRGDAGGARRR